MAKSKETDIKLSDLIPDDKNFNKGSEYGNGLIEKSFSKFGAGRSILIDKNNRIIAGNKSVENAMSIGLDDVQIVESDGKRIIAVKRMDIDLDTPQGREMALADNASAKANIVFDAELIEAELGEATAVEWGIEVADKLEAEEDDFDVPDGGLETDIVLGDLFEIGQHRLLCGDSTDSDAVAMLMNGQKADMVFTSPPYNGNTTMYDYVIVDGKKKRKDKPLYEDNETDNKTSADYVQFLHDVMNVCFLNTDGFIFWNINYNAKSRFEFIECVYPYKESLQETIIWKKNAIPTANGFTRNFEFIFLFKTNQELKHINKEYDVTHNIWEVSNSGSQHDKHKACFPVELPAKAIGLNERTKLLFEPFTGSGTTMVAAHQLNRKCYGMELSPNYCQVIVDRMLKLDPSLEIKKNGVKYEHTTEA